MAHDSRQLVFASCSMTLRIFIFVVYCPTYLISSSLCVALSTSIQRLVEVHMKLRLVPSTLYLAVNIIDRYLAKEQMTRPKLQLLSWHHWVEIYQVTLNDCKYICNEAYDKEEILDTETALWSAYQQSCTGVGVGFDIKKT